jgi:molecular chaperone DnaJ
MPSANAAPAEARQARDYYDVLGVARTADPGAIRQAYLRLARELHPDVSNEPEAEERFQELTAAYTVLSDRGARLLYDRFGYPGRGNGFAAGEGRPGGTPILAEVDVDVFEAARGARREVRYSSTECCEACDGEGFAPGSHKCAACRGKGTCARAASLRFADWLQVETCADCDGVGIPAADRCAECGGTGSVSRDEVITVRLPAGVEDGTRLRVVGNPEDEHLLVQVRPPPDDSRLVRVLAAVLLVCAVALLVYFLSAY